MNPNAEKMYDRIFIRFDTKTRTKITMVAIKNNKQITRRT